MSKQFMSKKFTRNLLAAAVAVGVQATVGQVMASEDDPSLTLEEIVVTAQKREQSLQDVPSTVNAIQGDALTDLKLFNFTDLEQMTPGLDMRNVSGRSGSVALRGVDYNPNTAAAAAVDVYWNDVTLGSNASGGIFQEMFDLGRVEVLRGPQGTLQGRTSPAGAIAIHTAKPNLDKEEGYARTTFTNNSGNNSQFAVSLPIIPGELAVRVAGVYNDSEMDEVKNHLGGGTTNTHATGGRITVAWQPTETLATELVYQHLENDRTTFATLDGASTLGQSLPALSGSDRQAISLEPDQYNGRFENVSLTVDWEVADHQLTFVSGYSEVSSALSFDNSQGNSKVGDDDFVMPPAAFLPPALKPFGGVNLTSLFPQLGALDSQLNSPQTTLDQNYASSQELRIASIDNEFWDYTLGVFYGNESGFFKRQQVQANAPAALAALGGEVYFDAEVRSPFNVQSYGAFAHNMFQLPGQWSAQLGLRWQRQERTAEGAVFALEDIVLPPFMGGTTPAGQVATLIDAEVESANTERWTGSASLQYAFAEQDIVAYISAGTSFRPGGITVSAADLGNLTAFNEEDSWSLELGVKSELLEGRLRLNAAIFHQDYNDYISRATRLVINKGGDITKPGEASLTTNGDARVQGIETDFEYLLTENWHLAGGISYVEAEYQDGAAIPCNDGAVPDGTVANTCDVGGLELGVQPRVSATISTNYTIPFDAFEGYVQGLYKFTGHRTDVDAPSGDLGGYGTVDVHLGLREASGHWDVSLFARNLFDKETTENVEPELRTMAGTGTGYKRVQVAPQRLLGLSATYSF